MGGRCCTGQLDCGGQAGCLGTQNVLWNCGKGSRVSAAPRSPPDRCQQDQGQLSAELRTCALLMHLNVCWSASQMPSLTLLLLCMPWAEGAAHVGCYLELQANRVQ